MMRRRSIHRGNSQIEVIFATALSGILMAGALQVSASATAADSQAIAHARVDAEVRRMLGTILALRYAESETDTLEKGVDSKEVLLDPETWDDMDDPNGFSNWGSVPGTSGSWLMRIAVEHVDVENPQIVRNTPTGLKRVTVSVQHQSLGSVKHSAVRGRASEQAFRELPETGTAFSQPNLPPAAIASALRHHGGTQLKTQLSAAGSVDPEGDDLSYRWLQGDVVVGTGPSVSLVIQGRTDQTEVHEVVLEVTDPQGAIGRDSVRLVTDPAAN